MLRTVSNGQSIHQYIPPDLRRMFYKNPARVHASQNGLDPYGFSTDGLVLYLPLWALKDSEFKSVDVYRHTCSVTGALWQPDGRLYGGGDDYISCGNASSLLFTSGAFSVLAWVYITDLTNHNVIMQRGRYNLDGWRFLVNSTGDIYFDTSQTTPAVQSSKSAVGEVVVNTWYLLGATRDGASAIPYKNGVDVADTAGTHINPSTNSRNLLLGMRYDLSSNPFYGTMGEAWVYSRALTPTEMLNTYNTTAWRY